MLDRYLAQVRLLINVLPEIARETAFALKGGTAIKLFYRDLPRLSVDLDLTWLPIADRRSSLRDIDAALERITAAISRRYSRYDTRRVPGGGGGDTRVMVRDGRAQVKIETSPVTRGTVYPALSMPASEAVTERFGFVEANVLAFEDLYGGKLHAVLDRRHPRDLFDVKLLYENEGLTDDLFRAFMVYVASSRRPMHELLAPTTPMRADLYDEEFAGMTREPVSRAALVEAGLQSPQACCAAPRARKTAAMTGHSENLTRAQVNESILPALIPSTTLHTGNRPRPDLNAFPSPALYPQVWPDKTYSSIAR